MEMTLEKKKAIARAKARLRANKNPAVPIPATGTGDAMAAAGMKGDLPMGWDDAAKDWAASLGTGLYKGVAGLVGLPYDAGKLIGGGLGYGIDRLRGYSPEEASARKQQADALYDATASAPGYADIIAATESITGPLHEPKTTAGQYLETIGEFAAPGIGGKAGLLRKGAQILVPALASETAGQATKGSGYETAARVGGGLLGGIAAASRSGRVGTKEMLKKAPAYDEVKAATRAAYNALDDAKIVFAPNAYRSTAMKIQADLRNHGLLPGQGGEISTQLNQIMGRINKINGWTEIDSIRKNLGSLAAATAPELKMDAARATIMIKHLDDLVNTGQVMSMNQSVARDAIPGMVGRARELARRKIIADQIIGMRNKAKWYVSGDESGLRNQFASAGKRSGQRLSQAEEKAFNSVVRREGVLNPAHMAGSRLGLLTSAALGSALGPWGAMAAPLVSMASRKGMEMYTKAAVDKAMKTVLAGKAAQETAAAANAAGRSAAVNRGLLSVPQGRIGTNGPPGAVYRDARGVWWVTENGGPYVPGQSHLVPSGAISAAGQ